MSETPNTSTDLIKEIGFILFIGVKCGYLAVVILIALYVHYKKDGKLNFLSGIFLI